MVVFDWLNTIDSNLFLALNKWNSPFFDGFFSLFTSKEIWFPFYGLLLYLLIKKYRSVGFWIILMLVLSIVLSDQISGLIKDLVARPRPSHNESIKNLIHLTFVGRGGAYGFVSSHSANAFALAIFLSQLIKRKRIYVTTILWAALTAYSRIYVGVHYPFDILVGGILGGFIGWGAYKLLMLIDSHFLRNKIALVIKWKPKDYQPIIISLLFITFTLLVVSKLFIKYHLP